MGIRTGAAGGTSVLIGEKGEAALAGVVQKMEQRYQMMAALGVRSVDQFNGLVDTQLAAGNKTFRMKGKPGEPETEVEFRRLPYIVVARLLKPVQRLLKKELIWTATEVPGTEVAEVWHQEVHWRQPRRRGCW